MNIVHRQRACKWKGKRQKEKYGEKEDEKTNRETETQRERELLTNCFNSPQLNKAHGQVSTTRERERIIYKLLQLTSEFYKVHSHISTKRQRERENYRQTASADLRVLQGTQPKRKKEIPTNCFNWPQEFYKVHSHISTKKRERQTELPTNWFNWPQSSTRYTPKKRERITDKLHPLTWEFYKAHSHVSAPTSLSHKAAPCAAFHGYSPSQPGWPSETAHKQTVPSAVNTSVQCQDAFVLQLCMALRACTLKSKWKNKNWTQNKTPVNSGL